MQRSAWHWALEACCGAQLKSGPQLWLRAGPWFAAIIFLAYGVALWCHPRPPSLTDYANWTYQGVLLSSHMRGLPDTAHILKHYPVPNSAATLGVGLLATVLPWQAAAKTWLCLQWLLSFVCLRSIQRSRAQTPGAAAVWWIVPGAVFLNVNFWFGFVNFQLGLGWVLLMGALLLRRVRGSGKDWPLGVLLLVTFFTHMIPFVVCALLVVAFAWQMRRGRVLWQLAPAVAVSVWYGFGRYLLAGNADGQTGMGTGMRYFSALFLAHKVNSFFKSLGYVDPQGLNRFLLGRGITWALLMVVLGVGIALAWAMAGACRSAFSERRDERFLWAAILLVLPLFLLAPETAFGVSDPGARLLQAVLALALTLMGTAKRWPLRIGAVGTVLLTLISLGLFVRLAFAPHAMLPAQGTPLALHTVQAFAFVPYTDQDYFLKALERGDLSFEVFPTGMLLNSPQATRGEIPMGPTR